MNIKLVLAALGASALGCIVGLLAAKPLYSQTADTFARLSTRQLEIVDEHGRVTARLGTARARTTFTLIAQDNSPAVEIGLSSSGRYMSILGEGGRVVASISSGPPQGEATLNLGDNVREGRISIGALRSDTDRGVTAVEDWGLQMRAPGSAQPLFAVLITSQSATVRAIGPKGKVWTK